MSEHIESPDRALMSVYAGVATEHERELVRQYIDQLRAALAAATADRDAVLKANGALNQELRAMQAQRDPDRLGTHWAGCWRDGGRRHWQCAVAEAERQTARADAAERGLDDLHVMLSCLPEYICYYNDTDGPALSLAEWWAALPGMDESEAQP